MSEGSKHRVGLDPFFPKLQLRILFIHMDSFSGQRLHEPLRIFELLVLARKLHGPLVDGESRKAHRRSQEGGQQPPIVTLCSRQLPHQHERNQENEPFGNDEPSGMLVGGGAYGTGHDRSDNGQQAAFDRAHRPARLTRPGPPDRPAHRRQEPEQGER